MKKDKKEKKISSEAFDSMFESGEDLMEHLDLESAQRPGRGTRRVNVDFPAWIVEVLDQKAEHIGITRQSLIKVIINEYIERESSKPRNRYTCRQSKIHEDPFKALLSVSRSNIQCRALKFPTGEDEDELSNVFKIQFFDPMRFETYGRK